MYLCSRMYFHRRANSIFVDASKFTDINYLPMIKKYSCDLCVYFWGVGGVRAYAHCLRLFTL